MIIGVWTVGRDPWVMALLLLEQDLCILCKRSALGPLTDKPYFLQNCCLHESSELASGWRPGQLGLNYGLLVCIRTLGGPRFQNRGIQSERDPQCNAYRAPVGPKNPCKQADGPSMWAQCPSKWVQGQGRFPEFLTLVTRLGHALIAIMSTSCVSLNFS